MAAAELAMLLTLKNEAGPGLAKAEQEVSGFGSKISSVGSGLATAFGGAALAGIAAVGAGFAIGVAGASELDAATSKLQGQLGLTSDQASELGGVVESVFRNNFGESRAAVGDAIASIRQNMGELTPEATKTATESALALESLFDAPVAESSRAVGVMMKNFAGLSETQAFDLIAAGFQRGGNYSDELLDTLREYSPQFASMGLSAEQAMGVLLAGAEAGAFNLDKVGDAVKEFNIRAQDGSKGTAEGFAAIGLNADKMGAAIAQGGPAAEQAFQATLAALASIEDPLVRNQAGVKLFGTQWEDLGPTVVTAMAEGLKGVEGYEGAMARASATTGQSFPAAMEGLRRAFEGLLVDAVLPLMPHLTSFVNWFASVLPGAFAAVQTALAPFATQLMDVLVPAFAAVMVALPGVVGLIQDLFDIFSGGDSFDAAAEALDSVFGTATTDMILEFVAMAGDAFREFAGFVTEQFGVVVSWVQENWPLIQETIQTVLRAIAAFWDAHGAQIIEIVSSAWEIVKTVIAQALDLVLSVAKAGMQLINGDVGGALETLGGLFMRTMERIGTIVSEALDIILTSLDFWTGGMLTAIGTWMSDTSTAISDGMTAVETAISTGWETIKSTVASILPTILTTIMSVWNQIPEDIRTDLVLIATHIVTAGATWVSNLTTAGASMLTAISTALTNMVTAATTWATSTFLAPVTGLAASTSTAMTTAGSGMLSAITASLGEIVGAVTTWANSTFLAPLRGLVESARSTAASIGQAIVDGVRNAISSGAGAIRAAIESAVRGALNAAKAALGIESPSKVFNIEVGQQIVRGVMAGVDVMSAPLDRALAGLVQTPTLATVGASGSFGGGAAAGGVVQHEHSIRVGDVEAMRIVAVGRDLETRVYGSNA